MAIKVIFFGNERIATAVNTSTPTLLTLVEYGFEVCAVVINNEITMSRKQRVLEVESYAKEQNIPILSPSKLSDITEQLKEFGAEIAVLVAYGKIIPQAVIDIFPHGIINIHPSLLPLHRGSTPIESVILSGAKETGVSIMSLEKAMDAGPVYRQNKIELNGNESKQELADKLLALGAKSVPELITSIVDGAVKPVEQNNENATYDEQIKKANGNIDWNKPAEIIAREIRAYAGWPQSRTKLGDVEVLIIQAHAVPSRIEHLNPGEIEHLASPLVVACGEGSLCIELLKPIGKNDMDASSFLAGYKNRLKN